jgi:sugar transferase (PEP-CTERM/EpsH1 system associated)
MRSPLLFLAHRVPYPPNKGDKIRSFHLLERLASRHRVFLGAFADAPEDLEHAGTLAALCEEVRILRLRPRLARLASLQGLLQGQPLTVPYYRCRAMQEWVDQAIAGNAIDRAVVFSSAMAPYLLGKQYQGIRRVVDFVDVDSDKWAQYAQTTRPAVRWIYRRESARLLALERQIAGEFDGSVFVSAAEAALFRRLAPESAGKVTFASNGVDTLYFDPALPLPSPYPEGEKPLVFTGAMDYWPNVDAVCWFAEEILPAVLKAAPDAVFYAVGARPAPAVQRLARLPGVRIPGQVPDVRPYLRHAAAVVAPLRIARGIQNKVLEGMAMARPTVVTPAALEGIEAVADHELLVAADARAFADQVVAALSATEASAVGAAARCRVLADFDWNNNLSAFDRLLEGPAT